MCLCSNLDGALSLAEVNSMQAALRRRKLPLYASLVEKYATRLAVRDQHHRDELVLRLLRCVAHPYDITVGT